MTYNMVFVLGYDLLNKELKNVACDIAYDLCLEVYHNFLDSYYVDMDCSEYDALQKFIADEKQADYIIEQIKQLS